MNIQQLKSELRQREIIRQSRLVDIISLINRGEYAARRATIRQDLATKWSVSLLEVEQLIAAAWESIRNSPSDYSSPLEVLDEMMHIANDQPTRVHAADKLLKWTRGTKVREPESFSEHVERYKAILRSPPPALAEAMRALGLVVTDVVDHASDI